MAEYKKVLLVNEKIENVPMNDPLFFEKNVCHALIPVWIHVFSSTDQNEHD